MKAQTITERARELREEELRRKLKAVEKLHQSNRLFLEKLEEAFKKVFASVIPLMEADQIRWKAYMYDPQYEYKGGYILFAHKDRSTKIDLNPDGSWRTRSTVYSSWEMDKFILLLADDLKLLDLDADVVYPPHPNFEDGV